MPYLRCTSCGAKALSAATQCPRCTTPFHLTDAQGRRVPLRACRGCGYLRRADADCHWCGVLPPPAWRQPPVQRRLAMAAVAVLVVAGAWGVITRSDVLAGGDPVPTVVTRPLPRGTEVQGEDGGARYAGVAIDPPAVAVGSVSVAPAVRTVPAPPVPEMVPAVGAAGGAADSVRWVRAVARTWVNVRREASRDSEVVGVIEPEGHALLEAGRSGWRRVRSAAFRGWVDPRLFVPDSVAHRGG